MLKKSHRERRGKRVKTDRDRERNRHGQTKFDRETASSSCLFVTSVASITMEWLTAYMFQSWKGISWMKPDRTHIHKICTLSLAHRHIQTHTHAHPTTS